MQETYVHHLILSFAFLGRNLIIRATHHRANFLAPGNRRGKNLPLAEVASGLRATQAGSSLSESAPSVCSRGPLL